jgi:leucyl/phenylalanyl-tRNA--protein transferase
MIGSAVQRDDQQDEIGMLRRSLERLRNRYIGDVYALTGVLGRRTMGVMGRVLGAPRLAGWAVEMSEDPQDAAIRAVEEFTPFEHIEAAHIAGKYLEGYALMGRDGQRPAAMFRHFPDRAVIDAGSARVPKRVQSYLRRSDLVIGSSAPLLPVLEACADRPNSWVVKPVMDAWLRAEAAGIAVTWTGSRDGELVAGMWGISLGRTFGIASMFHRDAGAGAVVMASLLDQIGTRWDVIDCGGLKPHFERFGAYSIPVSEFRARTLAGLVGTSWEAEEPRLEEQL